MNIKASAFICFLLSCFLVTPLFAEEEEASAPATVQYHELSPPFVANFGAGGGKKLKFLKAGVSLRVSSDAAVGALGDHDALVRHQIVMLLSRQSDETLSTSAGQEKIRLEALEAVKVALKEETGNGQIDDLLFTSFVVQR